VWWLALGFIIGIITLLARPELPSILFIWALPPTLLLLFFWPRLRLLWSVIAGLCWALLQSYQQLQPVFPPELEGQDIVIEAKVVGIPEVNSHRVRFIAKPVITDGSNIRLPRKLRLAWYKAPVRPKSGERWRLQVRLKRPHGFQNPGGFDYERWLFTQGIGATGYVRNSHDNQRIAMAGSSIDSLRERISALIRHNAIGHNTGLLQAISLGIRSEIDPAHWDTLVATGTNHLVAISGLHIGLVAGFGYGVFFWLWRLSPKLCVWMPAQRAAALLSLIPALMYAALAGFSVPTQRALIMLLLIALGIIGSRPVTRNTVLAIALLAVLVFDSLAVLSPGFWLSFSAVAVIFLGHWGSSRSSGRIWQLLRVQWWLSLALLPLTFWFFGQGSLVSPLANFFAVPIVGLLVVPLTLIGIVMLYVYQPAGAALLFLADTCLDGILSALKYLATLHHALAYQNISSLWILLLLLLAAGMVFMPRGLPGKWLAIFWLIPVFLIKPSTPEYGGFKVSFLDVGQGLSVIVQTQKHTLVYDTGARFSSRFSAAKAVILPYLRQQGVEHIDTLVLSHSDNDHSGGAVLLRDAISVNKTLSSFPLEVMHQRCLAGQVWEWEGIYFRMLHPADLLPGSDNDQSCVLSIENSYHRVLLTGDISRKAEGVLLKSANESLSATVLQVPHHGSLTSSSEPFIHQVKPQFVVFNVGYRNRFGFPKASIVKRYQQSGAQLLRTDEDGAVIFEFMEGDKNVSLTKARTKMFLWQR